MTLPSRPHPTVPKRGERKEERPGDGHQGQLRAQITWPVHGDKQIWDLPAMGQDQFGMLACIWAQLSSTHGQALSCWAAGSVAQVGPRQDPQLKVAALGQGSALAMATSWHLGASPHITRYTWCLGPRSQTPRSGEGARRVLPLGIKTWMEEEKCCLLKCHLVCAEWGGSKQAYCWNIKRRTLRSVLSGRCFIGLQDFNQRSQKKSQKIQVSTEG